MNVKQNREYLFKKYNLPLYESDPNDVRNYFEYCTVFSLKQLIVIPSQMTCCSSSVIDHVLANLSNIVTQPVIVNAGLSYLIKNEFTV